MSFTMELEPPTLYDTELNDDIFLPVLKDDLSPGDVDELKKKLERKIVEGSIVLPSVRDQILYRFQGKGDGEFLNVGVKTAFDLLYESMVIKTSSVTEALQAAYRDFDPRRNVKRDEAERSAFYHENLPKLLELCPFTHDWHQTVEKPRLPKSIPPGKSRYSASDYGRFAHLLSIRLEEAVMYRVKNPDSSFNRQGFYFFFQRIKRSYRILNKLQLNFKKEIDRIERVKRENVAKKHKGG